MSFASLASFITSIKVGKFLSVSKDAPRKLIMLSTIFYFLSMLMVPFIDYVWLLIIPSILFGVGQGINLPSIQYALTSLAPMEQRGAIMSVNGTVFRLGQTIGPLIVIPVYAIWNINGAFSVGAGIAILMLFVAWTIKISKND
jgi:MFS family permease